MFKPYTQKENQNLHFQIFELCYHLIDLKILKQTEKTVLNIKIGMSHILFPSAILMSISFTSRSKVISVMISIWTVRVWMITLDINNLRDKKLFYSVPLTPMTHTIENIGKPF